MSAIAPSRLLIKASCHWYVTKDGDTRALALYERHYSCRRNRDGKGRRFFCGPGEKVVLISRGNDALFVWRKQRFTLDGQRGVNCSIFRNEGKVRSTRLIQEAMTIAWRRWPAERLYTYVDPRRVRSSNPGFCFKQAGWRVCGETRTRRLLILEAYSEQHSS